MNKFAACTTLLLIALESPFVLADLVVEAGYVRGLPPGVANTAAYMTLRNSGTTDVVLTGATTPIAGSVTLHSTMDHEGMLHMMPLESVRIPSGGALLLESGGTHLMLENLQQMPAPGTDVQLTLQFADGTTQVVNLPVKSVLDE